MGKTIIEKILGGHAGKEVSAGGIIEFSIDVRAARDFGGANVVKNLKDNCLGVDDPKKTFFTFDCNPGGSDQKYATNQQLCRQYARETGINLYDIQTGIGTHNAIDCGLVGPGDTFVSTDSHANIMGAIGAFGQGMGDVDIAQAFAYGKVWFKVPKSVRVMLKGKPGANAAAKDIALRMLQVLGANGLLGYSAEVYGDAVFGLTLDERITISSLATEMGGIILFFTPNDEVLKHYEAASGKRATRVAADADAEYESEIGIDVNGLEPLISRPGHPEDVIRVAEVAGLKVDSCFIGSCTNGRMEDLRCAAEILKGRKVAPGVVLKIVPATAAIYRAALEEGLIDIFVKSGALIGNPGCAGCAEGQIGQNGPGEVTVSTGNRNFAGKQGKGQVYLASPQTVAATAVSGIITTADAIPEKPVIFKPAKAKTGSAAGAISGAEAGATGTGVCATKAAQKPESGKPTAVGGRAWVIPVDNIDTDMIFHNRYLQITKLSEMGQYTFDNLKGWEDFAKRAKPGDIIVAAKNFGAGSSRQQAVDCFKALGISVIVAESFGAIYERNAINAGFPIMTARMPEGFVANGDAIRVDFESGRIENLNSKKSASGEKFSELQMKIYKRGGLLS
ncbi:MAG: homoaconitate hydratase [Thermoplasmata archaeon HGW-Thermoplasmata-1]|nr:MAG: homoaconitate hydratase [Thermoplasmata archaeon HGW-Thermoplasmata-1]